MYMYNVAKYGSHDLHNIGFYSKESFSKSFVIFIHGGAWRDPRNTHRDADTLMAGIVSSSVTGASIDYRLSPEVVHPAHVQDVASALDYISKNYQVDKVVLVGHSAGATIALQLFMRLSEWSEHTQLVLSKVISVVASEGIYDIGALMNDDPSYEGFVKEAFGQNSTYENWDAASPASGLYGWESRRANVCLLHPEYAEVEFNGRLVVVHSPEDELLNINIQPKIAEQRMGGKSIEIVMKEARGRHDEVYTSRELIEIVREEISYS